MHLAPSTKRSTAATHSSPAPRRIVVALDSEERRLFVGAASTDFAQLPGLLLWLEEADLAESGWHDRLRQAAPEILVTGWATPPLPMEWLQSSECPLRYVCHLTGSVRRLVPRAFLERGGQVTNWGTLASAAVAEHALLLGLAALRNLPAWHSFMRRPQREQTVENLGTRSLFGRRVGVHGFGAIARELVNLLRPFRVSISAYSAGVPAKLMTEVGVQPCGSLHALFSRNEVVFDCEALTPRTEGSVTADLLAALPDHAVFVNVGRGRIADESALLAAARSGRIRVAVDVLSHEPIAPDSPWLEIETALVSPHIGGPTLDLYPQLGVHALDNIQRFLGGKPLTAEITLEKYDRST